ncbi:DUF1003 domain-containing protein [Patescibacteria group bacterium]|nr:DUF1003 domain-containing protein [Patescibacteria group bacterium]
MPNHNEIKVKKKADSFMDKLTDYLSWFLGSWWAVFFHTFWFSIWLILDFNIDLLTFSVSLEAIFIGIFLLMASNKAEKVRDNRATRDRKSDRRRLELDIRLDEKADRQLTEIKRLQKELHQDIRLLKIKLSRIEKALTKKD